MGSEGVPALVGVDVVDEGGDVVPVGEARLLLAQRHELLAQAQDQVRCHYALYEKLAAPASAALVSQTPP